MKFPLVLFTIILFSTVCSAQDTPSVKMDSLAQDQNNLFALPFDYRIGFTNNF